MLHYSHLQLQLLHGIRRADPILLARVPSALLPYGTSALGDLPRSTPGGLHRLPDAQARRWPAFRPLLPPAPTCIRLPIHPQRDEPSRARLADARLPRGRAPGWVQGPRRQGARGIRNDEAAGRGGVLHPPRHRPPPAREEGRRGREARAHRGVRVWDGAAARVRGVQAGEVPGRRDGYDQRACACEGEGHGRGWEDAI